MSGGGRGHRSAQSRFASMTVQLPFNYRPDGPITQFVAHDLSRLRKRKKQPSLINLGRRRPGLDSLLHPDRNRHRSNSTTLAAEIDDHPPSLSELNILDVERC